MESRLNTNNPYSRIFQVCQDDPKFLRKLLSRNSPDFFPYAMDYALENLAFLRRILKLASDSTKIRSKILIYVNMRPEIKSDIMECARRCRILWVAKFLQ